jgi:serine/threonine-protein kinase
MAPSQRQPPPPPPSTRAVPRDASAETEALAQNTLAFTGRLAQTPDPAAFGAGAQKLEAALRTLASRGDVKTLWSVSSAMNAIAAEGKGGTVGSRAWSATRLLRVFDDPTILVNIAEQLLGGPQDARDSARKLIVHAGVAGAYGLYGARVKLARMRAVRPHFVSVLKDFGPKAWPVVRAALEKISAIPSPNVGTLDLAEDLLLCVPAIGDEQAGHVVLKFLRVNHSGVCRAATAGVVKLWGERARPVLVGMVQSKEDLVRVAGLAGLRQLGAIDGHLVPRLQAILTRRDPAGEEVRAAAALALAHVSESARQPALSLLTQLLTPGRDGATHEPQTPGMLSKQDAVVIALARSLLAVGGRGYRGLIAERADRSSEPLRGQLRELLTK